MSDKREPGRFEKLFGRVVWDPPRWLGSLNVPGTGSRFGELVKANATAILAIVALLGAGGAIYSWVRAHPPAPPADKLLLKATATPPDPPPARKRTDPTPAPAPLVIRFDGSAAPLDQVN